MFARTNKVQTEIYMGIGELFILAVALAMDAFAVSICKGLASKENYIKTGLVCGIWFGFFQALMPFIGWLIIKLAELFGGAIVADYINSYSAYIAFALLMFLGVKMIVEAVKEMIEAKREAADGVCLCDCNDEKNSSLAPRVMIVFAIATSIDALAAGLPLAAVNANIFIAVTFIGVVTFLCSFIGSAVGARIGSKFSAKAEVAGGLILCALGIKILVEYFVK